MPDFSEMSWEDMEVIPHENGSLMFPAELRRRDATGKVVKTPVRVRIPDATDHFEAIPMSRNWLIALKIDAEKDPKALSDALDLVTLSTAIRTAEAPHSQLLVPQELAHYDEGCINDIKERVNYFKQMLDPRETVQTDEEFWSVVAEVKRKRRLLPLADIVGQELPSFLMRLVWEASKSQTEPSTAPSSETSTQDS